jgi:hypothetical protein
VDVKWSTKKGPSAAMPAALVDAEGQLT